MSTDAERDRGSARKQRRRLASEVPRSDCQLDTMFWELRLRDDKAAGRALEPEELVLERRKRLRG